MYPRLNPKVKRNTSQNKQKLNILFDENSYQSKYHPEIQNLKNDKNQNQLPVIRELSESKDHQNRASLMWEQFKEMDIFNSCQNQLYIRYNHLKGKRRSEEMTNPFYRQISGQKTQRNQKTKISKEKRLNSLRKIEVNTRQPKKNSNKLSQRSFSREQQRNDLTEQECIRFSKKCFEPLRQLKNQVRVQNQEYQKYKKCHNFLPKVMKKSSFFRNKIIEQIITNNIDEWKSEDLEDSCIF